MPRSRSRRGVAVRRMFAVAVAARTVAGLAAAGGSALAAFPGANGTIVVDAHVIPGGCAHVIPQLVGPC
jgi:hypothetical protein